MAKAVITLNNDTEVAIESSQEFFVNYDESKHGETIKASSNTQRLNKFRASFFDAMRGIVSKDEETGATVVDHTFLGFKENGDEVLLDGRAIVSVVISD